MSSYGKADARVICKGVTDTRRQVAMVPLEFVVTFSIEGMLFLCEI
jgi:hypothetical protein